ncbi:hypothetical protein H310_04427 [Aphanomyces invadans]|uniref:Uncharacterized protein n=1 Tax=Aphanomyces invadans TaxID=157072 RepID=A0A024UDS7_9STRA|nr:hypothetical protein H310_04427 [Aphanomyces invadans]ETW04042.1 hypothetical protein H310_04427 [Aphanomyces invadans]|eukprot:XP_008866998.1 hypothetical protein H310_04427 [Aphanomyces invadans]
MPKVPKIWLYSLPTSMIYCIRVVWHHVGPRLGYHCRDDMHSVTEFDERITQLGDLVRGRLHRVVDDDSRTPNNLCGPRRSHGRALTFCPVLPRVMHVSLWSIPSQPSHIMFQCKLGFYLLVGRIERVHLRTSAAFVLSPNSTQRSRENDRRVDVNYYLHHSVSTALR